MGDLVIFAVRIRPDNVDHWYESLALMSVSVVPAPALQADVYARALDARDARFDGSSSSESSRRAFTAVRFARPACRTTITAASFAPLPPPSARVIARACGAGPSSLRVSP